MNNWFSLSGILTVEITGAEPEKTFRSISINGISIFNIRKISDLTYQFQLLRRDYGCLKKVMNRRAEKLSVISHQGIFWYFDALAKRPLLTITFLFMFITALYVPGRVLFIEVTGNQHISERVILEAAENCGIQFGASRKQVRSEKVKNSLLSEVPQLQWAGINTIGCRAVISVRERNPQQKQVDTRIVSDLIAGRDGYILEKTVTQGTAMVKEGDSVTKGQILISGYTDCGLSIRAGTASGEILAQTNRVLTAVTPKIHHIPAAYKTTTCRISLLIRKKRINLWKCSRIFDINCGRMYSEYFVQLPGGFQLPFAICIDRYEDYEFHSSVTPEEDAQQRLQQFSDGYLLKEMTSGQILDKQQKFISSGDTYILKSKYICTEMIGVEQQAQIGAYNGKRD